MRRRHAPKNRTYERNVGSRGRFKAHPIVATYRGYDSRNIKVRQRLQDELRQQLRQVEDGTW